MPATALCQFEGSRGATTVEWREMAHLTPKQQDHQQGDNLKPIVHRGHCNPAGRDPWRDPPVPSASPRFCHFPGYCEVQGKETPALAKHSLPRRRLGQGWGGAGGDCPLSFLLRPVCYRTEDKSPTLARQLTTWPGWDNRGTGSQQPSGPDSGHYKDRSTC